MNRNRATSALLGGFLLTAVVSGCGNPQGTTNVPIQTAPNPTNTSTATRNPTETPTPTTKIPAALPFEFPAHLKAPKAVLKHYSKTDYQNAINSALTYTATVIWNEKTFNNQNVTAKDMLTANNGWVTPRLHTELKTLFPQTMKTIAICRKDADLPRKKCQKVVMGYFGADKYAFIPLDKSLETATVTDFRYTLFERKSTNWKSFPKAKIPSGIKVCMKTQTTSKGALNSPGNKIYVYNGVGHAYFCYNMAQSNTTKWLVDKVYTDKSLKSYRVKAGDKYAGAKVPMDGTIMTRTAYAKNR